MISDKESLWSHIAYIAAHHRDCNDSDKADGVTVGDLRAWRDEIEYMHLENAKLTSAAEAGNTNASFDRAVEKFSKRIAAAAEVDRGAQTGKALTGNLNEVSLGENSESVLHRHTIERCAQVAEAMEYGPFHIAAAIRSLKDKP